MKTASMRAIGEAVTEAAATIGAALSSTS